MPDILDQFKVPDLSSPPSLGQEPPRESSLTIHPPGAEDNVIAPPVVSKTVVPPEPAPDPIAGPPPSHAASKPIPRDAQIAPAPPNRFNSRKPKVPKGMLIATLLLLLMVLPVGLYYVNQRESLNDIRNRASEEYSHTSLRNDLECNNCLRNRTGQAINDCLAIPEYHCDATPVPNTVITSATTVTTTTTTTITTTPGAGPIPTLPGGGCPAGYEAAYDGGSMRCFPVTLQNDPRNCGRTGNVCTSAQHCVQGSCRNADNTIVVNNTCRADAVDGNGNCGAGLGCSCSDKTAIQTGNYSSCKCTQTGGQDPCYHTICPANYSCHANVQNPTQSYCVANTRTTNTGGSDITVDNTPTATPVKTTTPTPTLPSTITPTPTLPPGTTPTPTLPPGTTPTPTLPPGSTPTPTPNLATCNAVCTVNTDCSSGLVCLEGLCRNPVCSEKTTCQCPVAAGPTPKTPVAGTGPSVLGAATIAGGFLLILLGLAF